MTKHGIWYSALAFGLALNHNQLSRNWKFPACWLRMCSSLSLTYPTEPTTQTWHCRPLLFGGSQERQSVLNIEKKIQLTVNVATVEYPVISELWITHISNIVLSLLKCLIIYFSDNIFIIYNYISMKLRGLLVYMFFSLHATFCRSSEDFNWNKPVKTLYFHFNPT